MKRIDRIETMLALNMRFRYGNKSARADLEFCVRMLQRARSLLSEAALDADTDMVIEIGQWLNDLAEEAFKTEVPPVVELTKGKE